MMTTVKKVRGKPPAGNPRKYKPTNRKNPEIKKLRGEVKSAQEEIKNLTYRYIKLKENTEKAAKRYVIQGSKRNNKIHTKSRNGER